MSDRTTRCDDSDDLSRTSNLENAPRPKSGQKRNLFCTLCAEPFSVAIAALSCCAQTGEAVVETLAEPGTRDWWTHQLDVIIRLGCYPAALAECTELFDAPQIRSWGFREVVEQAIISTLVIDAAVSELGDPELNPRVRAARVLFGLDMASRGLLLKTRRSLAAQLILVEGADGPRSITVATWLRRYEPQLLADLSWCLMAGSKMSTGGAQQH